jgi:hypothetical protein
MLSNIASQQVLTIYKAKLVKQQMEWISKAGMRAGYSTINLSKH